MSSQESEAYHLFCKDFNMVLRNAKSAIRLLFWKEILASENHASGFSDISLLCLVCLNGEFGCLCAQVSFLSVSVCNFIDGEGSGSVTVNTEAALPKRRDHSPNIQPRQHQTHPELRLPRVAIQQGRPAQKEKHTEYHQGHRQQTTLCPSSFPTALSSNISP